MNYLDNNATTQVAPEVLEAMLPYLATHWGNPSSAYAFAKLSARKIKEARAAVAELVGADPREIIFTSCGTESNNAVLNSAVRMQGNKRHIVTTRVEHSSVLKCCQELERRGGEVSYLPVEADGSLDLHELERALRADTALVSIMWANNETGVIFPMEEIAAICRSRGVLFHTDAVQAAGKLKLDAVNMGIDYLSLSAHKFHAPKGIGVLYIRQGVSFAPFLVGGDQESGRRGGTENLAFIAGCGRAAHLALERLNEEDQCVRGMRDRLEREVLRTIKGSSRNGPAEPRLPNTTSIAFEGVEAEAVLLLLDQAGICVSSGSACSTGAVEPSHVLVAMGLSPERARGSLRFSLGVYNQDGDVEALLAALPPIIERLRQQSPRAGHRGADRQRAEKADTPGPAVKPYRAKAQIR